jgi:sugar phosphate isomerase/epimerase
MRNYTRRLIDLCEDGKQYSPKYEKIRTKLLLKREKRVPKFLDALFRSVEELLPTLEKSKVVLALENLPSWEAVPTEAEMGNLLDRFPSPWLAYWHDIGHGQVRQLLGLVTVPHWLTRFGPRLAGLHVHDVAAPAFDHLVPGRGGVRFDTFAPFIRPDMPLVMEPAPGTPAGEIREGVRLIASTWKLANVSA